MVFIVFFFLKYIVFGKVLIVMFLIDGGVVLINRGLVIIVVVNLVLFVIISRINMWVLEVNGLYK